MSKSTNATFAQRVNEIIRLLGVGAEFPEICEYATARGWGVCDRQIRRYTRIAYARIAKDEKRERSHRVSLQTRKCRTLFARSLQDKDNRSALLALKEESKLQGLYPSTKGGRATAAEQLLPHECSGSTIRKRAARYVAAELRNDQDELRVLENASICRAYVIADIRFATLALNTMTNLYVKEQLGYVVRFYCACYADPITGGTDAGWKVMMSVSLHQFWACREGWDQFAAWLGVQGDDLVAVHSPDPILKRCQERFCASARSAEDVLELALAAGEKAPEWVTPDQHAASWRQFFLSVCPEPSAG